MKKPKLKPGQRWRPNRGPWRYINGIGTKTGEIHWQDKGGYHFCTDEDFHAWIERTNAKLVRRKR